MGTSPGLTLALAGGVGGAKLALGLSKTLSPHELVIVVNTGDDEEFHGLHVSPDLDTVMYTLSDLANPDTGWGLAGETFQTLKMLSNYGAPYLVQPWRQRPGYPLTANPVAATRLVPIPSDSAPMSTPGHPTHHRPYDR